MVTNKKITDSISTTCGEQLDFALYDETGKKLKDFDCVVMKRKLQAIVQEKTKDMSTAEILAYLNKNSLNLQ
jgi:hypothetical protein